jgi:1-aminocyclopropane-1-carboxylate deaminase/D-cysteine desulfhydrase-like pyridoxal-dependent ACC family enzyme
MIDARRLMAMVLAIGCLAGGSASSAGTYTEEQMELAGKLGAAVALSRICTGTVPTTAIAKVLEASGLTEQDVLGETPIRERMQKQASAVMLANNLQKESGETQEEIVQSACDSFRANFGPNGLLLPGVAD